MTKGLLHSSRIYLPNRLVYAFFSKKLAVKTFASILEDLGDDKALQNIAKDTEHYDLLHQSSPDIISEINNDFYIFWDYSGMPIYLSRDIKIPLEIFAKATSDMSHRFNLRDVLDFLQEYALVQCKDEQFNRELRSKFLNWFNFFHSLKP